MNKALILTSYPKKRAIHGRSTVGVASYAKNTLLALRKGSHKKVGLTVLAEKMDDDTNYSHDGIDVKRVWERNSLLTFPRLLKELITKHRDEKILIIEFELAMFGNFIYLLPFPLFLLLVKILKKRIIIVIHQVVPNANEIGPHINIPGQSVQATLFNTGIRIFYTTVLLLSSKVIVFEDALKQKLAHFGNSKKIVVIPHGVEQFGSKISRSSARKKLGIKPHEFAVVSFGYLAWYKGTDWLVHAISDIKQNKRSLGKDIRLILAGGPNPNHIDKNHYNRYLRNITNEAEKNDIKITGFVPQNDIPLYYKAADVIVLPYRTYMSASGPLSMAFSFKKPFLLAVSLTGVLHQKDMQDLMSEYKVKENNILFKETDNELADALSKIRKNAILRNKLTKLSTGLAKKRDWKFIGQSYYEALFT